MGARLGASVSTGIGEWMEAAGEAVREKAAVVTGRVVDGELVGMEGEALERS